MTVKRTRAASSGTRRRCSHSSSVRTSRPNRSASFCLLSRNRLWRATIRLAANHRRSASATPSYRGRGREPRQAPFRCPVRARCTPCSSSGRSLLQRLLDVDRPTTPLTKAFPSQAAFRQAPGNRAPFSSGSSPACERSSGAAQQLWFRIVQRQGQPGPLHQIVHIFDFSGHKVCLVVIHSPYS